VVAANSWSRCSGYSGGGFDAGDDAEIPKAARVKLSPEEADIVLRGDLGEDYARQPAFEDGQVGSVVLASHRVDAKEDQGCLGGREQEAYPAHRERPSRLLARHGHRVLEVDDDPVGVASRQFGDQVRAVGGCE